MIEDDLTIDDFEAVAKAIIARMSLSEVCFSLAMVNEMFASPQRVAEAKPTAARVNRYQGYDQSTLPHEATRHVRRYVAAWVREGMIRPRSVSAKYDNYAAYVSDRALWCIAQWLHCRLRPFNYWPETPDPKTAPFAAWECPCCRPWPGHSQSLKENPNLTPPATEDDHE